MKEKSLKNALYNYFKGKEYVRKSTLMGICRKMRHCESNAERRLRELSQAGLITPEYERDGQAYYIVGYFNKKIK